MVTEQERTLLRALCRSDHMAYIPQGSSTSALRRLLAEVARLLASPEHGGPPHIIRGNTGVVCYVRVGGRLAHNESWKLSWHNLFVKLHLGPPRWGPTHTYQHVCGRLPVASPRWWQSTVESPRRP